MSTPAEPTTSPSHVGHGAESAFRPGDVIAGSFPADARGFVISFEGTVVAVDDVGARPTGLVIFRATSKHCAHPGHPERGRSLPAGEMHAIEPVWVRNLTRPPQCPAALRKAAPMTRTTLAAGTEWGAFSTPSVD
jgi:hypothetical protein